MRMLPAKAQGMIADFAMQGAHGPALEYAGNEGAPS